jgi:hypothetical protein
MYLIENFSGKTSFRRQHGKPRRILEIKMGLNVYKLSEWEMDATILTNMNECGWRRER